MKYSVIIPFHSNLNLLSLCIMALIKTLDFNESEIIIIDNNVNGSQMDHTIREDHRLKIITIDKNLMYPRAINLGAAEASGEFLLFCDADTCVTAGFHQALTNALLDESVGFTSAKLLNMQTNNVQEFGITSSYYNFPHPFSGRPYNFSLVSKNHSPLAACSACSAIKRDLFINIGGFDEELLHSYSDIDLCLRLAAKGYRTVCVANSIAYHHGSSTIGSGMGYNLKGDTKGVFASKHPHTSVQIQYYLDMACSYFLGINRLVHKDYFVFDCSTIGNPELYIDTVIEMLRVKETLRYKKPYPQRDAISIDYLNFVPHTICNYRIPILYFVDCFQSFKDNHLWKSCRADYDDIVLDRNANIELLRNID